MKTRVLTVVILLAIYNLQGMCIAQDLNVGAPRTVRLIYFLPNDRPYRANIVQRMKDQIIFIQNFYATQMEVHGYGAITFNFETDDPGDPVVHRLDGKRPAEKYTGPSSEVDEVSAVYNLNSNIYLVVNDKGASRIAVGIRRGRYGGTAHVAGPFLNQKLWWAAAHELGHAFGLPHDFRKAKYLMSYGSRGINRTQLSACNANFLSGHTYFNPDIPLGSGKNQTTINVTATRMYPGDAESIPIKLNLSDADGLLQVRIRGTNYSITNCHELDGVEDAIVEFNYNGFP